jgi:hypothetical protein
MSKLALLLHHPPVAPGLLPSPTGSARFLDGLGNPVTAPIVGQSLFIDPGPFSNSPTGYDYTVYSDGAIYDSNVFLSVGDGVIIVDDSLIGSQLQVKCHAINGTGTSATTSDSALTSAVTDIDLTNAITALTRTSASGTVPMTWNVTFGSNVYQDYTLRARVYSDSSLSTLVQDVTHSLTWDDLQSGGTINLAADGLTTPGATDWLQLSVEAVSPAMIFHSFTYGTAISPTDTVVPMTWSSADHTTNITLSGGNLSVHQGANSTDHIRGSHALGSGKYYWEVTVGLPYCHVGVADATLTLLTNGDYYGTAAFGNTPSNKVIAWSGNDSQIYYNDTGTTVAGYTGGDRIGVAYDATTKTIWLRKNGGSWLSGNPATGTGGYTASGLGSSVKPYLGCGGAGGVHTGNFGTTPGGTAGFTDTVPSGFVAP